VHQNPEQAASDGRQSLKPERFAALVEKVRQIAAVVNRSLPERETI
jgi:3-deoxy-7-phosphoheptulonate synthase